MLYDPKWNTKTEEQILSFENLAAWLRTKNPKGTYNYTDCGGRCLYGQYMKAHGIKWVDSGSGAGLKDCTEARENFCCDVYLEVARPTPWTFGDALERTEQFLRNHKNVV